MKKLTLTIACLALLTGAAFAGDYHTGASLTCSQCHVMHSSQAHNYAVDGTGHSATDVPASPVHFLLRDEINDLCLSCHDGESFAPDVLATGTTPPADGRQAGALNRDNTAPYTDVTGHTLGSIDIAPGGTWNNADGLNCINCHQQHGYGGFVGGGGNPYRNLLYSTGGVNNAPVSYAVAVNDLTKDVFERSASYGGDHYAMTNVDFNEPTTTGSAYGDFCKGCHTDFHGSSSDANMRNAAAAVGTEWYRHPAADANIGDVGGGHSNLGDFAAKAYRVQVMSSTGDWGTYGTPIAAGSEPAGVTPGCFSCHKSHGNQNAFGVIFATGAAALGEDGDGTEHKNLCSQCHVQGG